MDERKKILKKRMLKLTKSLKENIKRESWNMVRINLIDLKYLLNQVDIMEEE